MLTCAENVQAIHEYDRKALDEYIATKNKVATLKETLESEQAYLTKLLADREEQEVVLTQKLTEKEAEITINWKEHVKDPYNNWLAEVIDKTVTLNYSKDQFQQTPLNLTTKTVVLK